MGPGHRWDLLSPEVVEGFVRREIRPAVGEIRRRQEESSGADQLQRVLAAGDDPYALARAEQLLGEADLLRMATCLAQVQPHTTKLTRTIQGINQDIEQAQRVPAENAGSFRSKASRLYLLSCLPLLGLVPALVLRRQVEAYQTAFSSSLQVYRELGAEVLARNSTFRTVTLVSNFPAALMLSQVGKQLASYLGQAAEEPAAGSLARVE